jgi:hypothetical protein
LPGVRDQSQHACPLAGKKKPRSCRPLAATVVPAKRGDKLEIDELWSFVQKKANTLDLAGGVPPNAPGRRGSHGCA